MKPTISVPQAPAAIAEDHSVCLEWQGQPNQSYDSVDHLLHEVTHASSVEPGSTTQVVELTGIVQHDSLLPLSHYLL
jgi:hypothetical protein